MKAFLASAAMTLFATAAFAYGEVQINWPSVNGLAINNACATVDSFVSLTPVTTCLATTTVRYAVSTRGEAAMEKRLLAPGEQPHSDEWLQTEQVCSSYGSRAMTVSRNVTTTECAYYMPAGEASEPCSRFVSKTSKMGTTFSVEKITRYGQADQQVFFNYTVPACK